MQVPTYDEIMECTRTIWEKGAWYLLAMISVDLFCFNLYKFLCILRVEIIYRYLSISSLYSRSIPGHSIALVRDLV